MNGLKGSRPRVATKKNCFQKEEGFGHNSNTNGAVTHAGLGVFLVQVGFERIQDFVCPKRNGADTVKKMN